MRSRTEGNGAQIGKVQSFVWDEHGLVAAGEAAVNPIGAMAVVWDVGTGKSLLTLGPGADTRQEGTGNPRLIAWAPDGQSLATVVDRSFFQARRIDIWDVAAGRKTQTISIGNRRIPGADTVAWSPDGRRLACASAEAIQVINLALPFLPMTLRRSAAQHGPDRAFLAWSADGRSLAVLECRRGEHRSELTAWDLATGKERFELTRAHEGDELHAPLAWSPDGKRLALGGRQSGVWNVDSAKQDFTLAAPESYVVDVGWAPDGRRVFGRTEVSDPVARRFELRVWDATTGREVCMLRGPMAGWLVAPDSTGSLPSRTSTLRRTMSSCGTSRCPTSDLSSQSVLVRNQRTCALVHPDRRRWFRGAYSWRSGSACCWGLPPRAQDRPSPEEQELPGSSPSNGGGKALTYAADMRKAAQLVEGEQWDALRAILDEYRPSGGETDLREWEWHFLNALARKNQVVDPQQLAREGPSDPIEQLAWSGGGRRLAGVTSKGAVVIWDAKTGGLLRRIEGKAKWVCLDRDGQRVAIAHEYGPASLVEVETGRQIRAFDAMPRQGNERPIALSPDGKRVSLGVQVSGGMIVDAATGKDSYRSPDIKAS